MTTTPGPGGEDPREDLGPDWERLRAELRRQDRQEREENERWALQRMLQDRSLPDVVFELMGRGDQVTVEVPGGRRFTGRVTYAAGDLARVETPHLTVDFNLATPLALRVERRSRARGTGRSQGVLSFRARLKELERAGAAERLRLLQHLRKLGVAKVGDMPVPERLPAVLELGVALRPEPILGQVEAVAQDHVYYLEQGGAEWFLPLAVISYVAERRP